MINTSLGETQRSRHGHEQGAAGVCSPDDGKGWRYGLNDATRTQTDSIQDINIQNMDVELVAQMFKNYRSNVLFHLEGEYRIHSQDTVMFFRGCTSLLTMK
jgi:hypothetical protein